MKCKCGKYKGEGKARCKSCQNEYMRLYMEKKRSKILAEPKKEAEVVEVAKVEEVKPSIQPDEISKEDRNTIRDPNPDWCYERFPNINSSNKLMECHICGKLSLTHRKICVLESRNYAYDNCYATK